MRQVLSVIVLFNVLAPSAFAATYQVGADKPYKRISQLPPLGAGDVVEISPGTYHEAVRWTASGTAAAPIVIRGVGTTRPIIDGTNVGLSGVLPQPRALFQIEGHHVIVENLEFRNARNAASNGAGIRVLYARSTLVRNVRITACDMGMQGNGFDGLTVEHSEIASNGLQNGSYSHNVYFAEGGSVTFRFNYIHDSVSGLNFKSRSHFTQLLYNHIANSADGEISLVDSASTDQPYSHALMLGNLVVSKARTSKNNQAKFIDFGQDSGIPHRGVLYLLHNTLVAGTASIEFLWASSSASSIVAEHNIFYGSDRIVGMAGGGTFGSRNWMPATARIPSAWKQSVLGSVPGFVDAKAGDYRLASGSQAIDGAADYSQYIDGSGAAQSVVPEWEYVAPMQRVARIRAGAANDLGAYEARGGIPPPPSPGDSSSRATFIRTDSVTQGTWQGVYGTEAFVLAADGARVPSGMTVAPSGHADWTWTASTADVRALQSALRSSRIAAAWYGSSFVIDVRPADAASHQLAVYVVDWDAQARAETIEILDLLTGAVLDARTNVGGVGGKYLVWDITGPVRIRVTRTAGPNAVVSGVFLDAVGTPAASSPTAVFSGTDVTTQGTWWGVYGSQGRVLAQDGASLPDGSTVLPKGHQNWIWAPATADPRALLRMSSTDRLAATWYGSAFSIDVTAADAAPRRVALYVVDWDSTARGQRIEVVNPATGAVLDTRSIIGFTGGQYWIWTVTGTVQFRATRFSGANAVVSAVFLDPPK